MRLLDGWAAASSWLGLGVFVISHVIAFRYFKPRGFSRPLAACFLIGLAAVVGMWVFVPQGRALGAAIAVCLYCLLFLLFISWIFGMQESSVRVRILCELAARGEAGAALRELKSRYNEKTLLDIRLSRMTAGGPLRFESGKYRWAGSALLSGQIRFLDVLRRLLRL